MDEKTIETNVHEEALNTKIQLAEIVKKTSEQFLHDREKYVQNLVYSLFQRQNGLLLDIERMKKELKKKEEQLITTQDKVKKVIDGDWSVIKKIEEEQRNQKQDLSGY